MRIKRFMHNRAALLLALALFCSAALLQSAAKAADYWAEPYLNKMVSLGIMRGDNVGDLMPTKNITRAEFAAMINRAYGYQQGGPTPFKDVPQNSWFSQDIAIAYNTGYMNGTSPTTASPNGALTREEAVVMLGRNMMMSQKVGEVTNFTDSRKFSDWSRGYIGTASLHGLVSGYSDGSFRAGNKITRAEVAAILSNALGTVLNDGGTHELGGVYGNMTITKSGTTLKNTVVSGDLYISGGVGKGSVKLENVTVLGRIIVSGGGESEHSNNSVLLRNVDADELLIDRFDEQFITVRAEGDTSIGKLTAATSAYIEDATPTGYGFLDIVFDAQEKSVLDLSGNIEKVLNVTAGAAVRLAKGTAQAITMDETAADATLAIDAGATAYTVNLDAATDITGVGAIKQLNVAAPDCAATMLPDYIYVRPGLEASISGELMDNRTATESSENPRILAGYPAARDVASTSLNAVFSTNKKGVVYWAISSVSDGSINADKLISPPTYATTIIKSGSCNVGASSTEVTAKITGLTMGGTYYISAVLKDSRGMVSPVKVTSFTTPDDSVPAFASGYPYMSLLTNHDAQVAVMTTKSCQLYYAVLPKGSAAPTPQDFKANAVTGNLGSGSTDAIKNTTNAFQVNTKVLEETKSYDLYLWLTDYDGAKSSAVKKVTFTTVDKTPPVFNVEPTVNSIKATSIGATFNLNEVGTVYWVAVLSGTPYPTPVKGVQPTLDSETAKLQVSSGINAVKSGKVSAAANKDGTITISGLAQETAYDIYYIAQDKAGNYANAVQRFSANTLDTAAPKVTQEFTHFYGTNTAAPLADTDIRIVFDEGVQYAEGNEVTGGSLLALYNAVTKAKSDDEREAKKDALETALSNMIFLYPSPNSNNKTVPAFDKDNPSDDFVINYREATVTQEDKKMVVTFATPEEAPTAEKPGALNLRSGASYYFVIRNVADISTAENRLGDTTLPTFTTAFAQVNLSTTNTTTATFGSTPKELDMSFRMVPSSTGKVEDMNWDMLLWADTSCRFELYMRVLNGKNEPLALKSDFSLKGKDSNGAWELFDPAAAPLASNEGWYRLGEKQLNHSGDYDYEGLSLTYNFLPAASGSVDFGQLNELQEDCSYEYAIRFTCLGDSENRSEWSRRVNMKISVAAGMGNVLGNLSRDVTPPSWVQYRQDGATAIGIPEEFELHKQFSDTEAPKFADDRPKFTPGDTYTAMDLMLSRAGTVYYVIAPAGTVTTQGEDGTHYTAANVDDIPESGEENAKIVTKPTYLNIVNPNYSNSSIRTGRVAVGSGSVITQIDDLLPETDYYAYFVIKGTGQVYSDVYCYTFRTTEVSRPIIALSLDGSSASVNVNTSSTLSYLLLVYNKSGIDSYNTLLQKPFNGYCLDSAPAEYKASTYTVKDALTNDFVSDEEVKGSVFDIFANESIKSTVQGYVLAQASTSATIAKTGTMTVLANRYSAITCADAMSGSTEYLLLTVAKSDLGSGYAFRAISPLKLEDRTAPKVQECTFSVDSISGSGSTVKFTGKLRVVFDEEMYLKTVEGTEQEILPIEAVGLTLGGTPSDGFVSLTSALSPSSAQSIAIKNGTPKAKTAAFTFDVTNAGNNDAVVFSTGLCDAAGNTGSGSLMLKLVAEAYTDPLGAPPTYNAHFAISPASWDGTSAR